MSGNVQNRRCQLLKSIEGSLTPWTYGRNRPERASRSGQTSSILPSDSSDFLLLSSVSAASDRDLASKIVQKLLTVEGTQKGFQKKVED